MSNKHLSIAKNKFLVFLVKTRDYRGVEKAVTYSMGKWARKNMVWNGQIPSKSVFGECPLLSQVNWRQ